MANYHSKKNKKTINMDPKEKKVKEEELEDTNTETNEQETEDTVTKEVADEGNDIEKLLEEANSKVEDLEDKYLRLSAEFDNYRKRTMKEKAELIKTGGEKVVSSILPILDDLERAIKNMETSEDIVAMKEGVELIYNKFMKILAENGVQKIETKDKDFDTDYHEAIALVPAPTEEQKGKILDCVQNGYTLNDKVVRHAKVVVGQ